MILAEDRLKELFNTLPELQGSEEMFKPSYGFGSRSECIRFLDSKKGLKHYPLVWLETPFETEGPDHRIDFRMRLILAELSNSEMSNEERLEITFKPMLLPLYDNVIKALDKSGFTKILNRDKMKRTNHFNFGLNDEAAVTEIWDAIKFECTVQMTDCPINEIIY